MAISKSLWRDIQMGRIDETIDVLFPGQRHFAPITPYCRICGQPAERVQIPKVDWYGITIVADCCGKQQGKRLSIEEYRRVLHGNEKLWLVVGKHEKQTIERIGGRIQVGGVSYAFKKKRIGAGV